MCMFTYAASGLARVKGIEKFECGACPECLQKKSRLWALRASMEAKVSSGVMVTLTYDSYKEGSKIEENPVDTSLSVNKKHCQDFIKRLRKHFRDRKIKYLLTAEYGKRTHRAHYHALLFNVTFDDLIQYKKSKRNNIIYKSKTLEKIWSHGICTVDCINISAKTARYCTKYCAKDAGVDDTFMLFSRGIGEEMLLSKFNGKSYWIDGREYAIPRQIWQKYIEKKYNLIQTVKKGNKERKYGYSRYVGIRHLEDTEKKIYNNIENPEVWKIELQKLENSALSYQRQQSRREIYFAYRDGDFLYKRYLEYWKRKNAINEISRPDEIMRILALPDNKYWSYKQKSLACKVKQVNRRLKRHFTPPRSNCSGFELFSNKKVREEKSFAPLSRHYTANDTIRQKCGAYIKELGRLRRLLLIKEAPETLVSPF